MEIQDQTGAWLSLDRSPKRIVSLVPSISELLVYLELENELIGVTRFCSHPSSLRQQKAVLGGTKDPDLDKIVSLAADIVIANKEENVKEHMDELKTRIPVYVSDVNTISDNLRLISDLGEIFNRTERANEIQYNTKTAFESIKNFTHGNVLYIIWQEPIMAAGKRTIIDSLLTHSGFNNVVKNDRYPELSVSDIKKLKPDYIFLSSEPYPFKVKNQKKWEESFPDSRIILVDGRAFSWYGYCFQQTPKYIQKLWNEIQT